MGFDNELQINRGPAISGHNTSSWGKGGGDMGVKNKMCIE